MRTDSIGGDQAGLMSVEFASSFRLRLLFGCWASCRVLWQEIEGAVPYFIFDSFCSSSLMTRAISTTLSQANNITLKFLTWKEKGGCFYLCQEGIVKSNKL
jgi:hypothetical protein